MRREAVCAGASAFRDLPAWTTRERTTRLPRALPRGCAAGVQRTVCHCYYYDGRRDLAASGRALVASSGPCRLEGAGGRDETERQAAPCTHPVPPLTYPRARLAVMYPYRAYR